MTESILRQWGCEVSERYLFSLGRRWAYVRRVAALAESIAPAYGGDGDDLVAGGVLTRVFDATPAAFAASVAFRALPASR